jgi:hypothetical protein
MVKRNEKIIEDAKARFKVASDAESDNRLRAITDIRFVDLDEQWDAATKADREANQRPCMVINKCQGTIRQIVNDARQNKPRIKVRPVDDKADPQVAEMLNGLIRNIQNQSDADSAYDLGIDQAAKGGWGYWRIVTEYVNDDMFEQDIFIRRITNQFSVYLDPSAKLADKSDAGWGFVTEVLTETEFEADYPDTPITGWSDQGAGEGNAEWFTPDGVRIAEYYYKEKVKKTLLQILTVSEQGEDYDVIDGDGHEIIEQDGNQFILTENGAAQVVKEREVMTDKVMWCKLAGGEIIEGPTEQPTRYIPIVTCVGDEAWIEGEPIYKSAFYHAKDAQRLYNWARSNAVETLALSPKQPFIGTPEMFEGHEDEWDNAARTPKMRLTANMHNGGMPQRQALSIGDSGSLQEAMQAADDIKSTTGLYDASLGAQGNETSGRAIVARQRESDTSTFHFQDNQARAIKFTGRILLDMIPRIYDTERVVRLLNEDGSAAWGQINKRVMDPSSPSGYRVINDLSVGRYDVTCDVGPGYMTKRIESAEGMMQFLSAAPNTAQVLLPRLAKNLDWPEAEEIGAELQALFQPQQEQSPEQMQAMQMAQQLAMAKEQGALQKMQLEIQKIQQDMQMSGMKVQQDSESQQLDMQSQQLKNIGLQLENVKKQLELSGMEEAQVEQAMQIAQYVINNTLRRL